MIYEWAYATWIAAYPQFSTTVNSTQGANCFALAQLYCTNTDCAPIPYDTTLTPPLVDRQLILDLITAHIAQLQFGSVVNGQPVGPSPLVGRVKIATQGSVSVEAEMAGPDTAAWWNQTQFGASAYAAMAPYRTARYRQSLGRFGLVGAPYPLGYNGVTGPYATAIPGRGN